MTARASGPNFAKGSDGLAKLPRLKLAHMSPHPRTGDPMRDPPDTMHPWNEDGVEIAQAWVEARREDHFHPPYFTGGPNAAGRVAMKPGHDDRYGFECQMSFTLGSLSTGFHDLVVRQLMNAPGVKPEDAVQAVNDGLAFLAANRPENERETMILLQYWMSHIALTKNMASLGKAANINLLAAHGAIAVKLGNLCVKQLEAFAKQRGGGKQEVVVTHGHQHVYVADGGQAVVGTLSTGGGADGENGVQSQGAVASLAFAPGSPVWSEDPARDRVPVPSDARESAMSRPRGKGRRSEG